MKRFLAAFGDPAVSQQINVTIDVNGYIFKAEGRTPTYEGWMVFYKPYVRFNQHKLPELHKGDSLKNLNVEMEEKFTHRPTAITKQACLPRWSRKR